MVTVNDEIEKRIEELLQEMTLEEKVSLCHANSKFATGSVKRLGIEELTMSDGPHGVRAEVERDSWTCLNRPEDACTYLPTGTALAATWNPELGRVYGEVLGSEARYRGKDIILGPGVNLIRTPLCGRNFEYMSEDPCLIARMAPELVKGIQSQDVAACVKHYCLNNQELDRHHLNVEVSDRALHELYLKGFYSAIIEGEAWSVMGSYTKYQNQHCCHNDFLVNQVLKGNWGFDGVYLTDWGGAHDTEECIYHGLDIEMGTTAPYHEYYLADAFLEQARGNDKVRELLDDKVRRILRLMFRVNKFSPDRKKGEFNTKEHQQAAYDVASEAMVLLKNEDHLLPIDKTKLKKLLVVGPNADQKHAAGGSSSGIMAYYEITPLQGICDRLSEFCEIEYESGSIGLTYQPIPVQLLHIIDPVAGCRAYKQVAHIRQEDGSTSETISFRENGDIVEGKADAYDMVVSAEIPETGCYSFRFYTNGNALIKINGEEHVKMQANGREQEATCAFDFVKGATVDIAVKLERVKESVHFQFGWLTPLDYENSSSETELLEKARAADYVIYCGGLDHSYDTEGFDKKSMQLSSEQDVMIPKLLRANPNTIIALTAGSPVMMPWIDQAKAVVWTWYAGMETGHVLCDILTGDVCPSGKLPFTLPKTYADTPVARYGEYQKTNCRYLEDIFVGYRGYERDHIRPLFPFGHGLSYSSFEYSDLKVSVCGEGAEEGLLIRFKITNVGKVAAKETAQVYVTNPVCSVEQPLKALKDFKKVALEPGETTEVCLLISAKELSFYDEKEADWKLEPGEFIVSVGTSAEDIRLRESVLKPAAKHVLLIGDSIRMGYDKAVKNTLKDKANVYFPEENCRFASYVLRYLHEYKRIPENQHVDVLHWNAGLWDCLRLFGEEPHTPVEVYAYYIERICIRIKKLFPDAQVIFATSTSVQSELMSPDFKRYNEEIEKYNETAVNIVSQYGFQVNDLYAVSASLPGEAHSDAVHYYTPMGTRAFAEQVLSCLLPALGIDETVEYKEELYTDKPIGI